jgi:2-polyprenyl-3-methyl-5-hydroxy-6-metoxy-1,4-benzoquinol methylase
MASLLRRLRSRERRASRRLQACEVPDWIRRRGVAETFFVPWVDRVLPLAGSTVLEYGCGNGAVSAAFAPRAAGYLGLDIDEGAIRQGQELLEQEGVEAELHAVPASEILDEVAALRGEIDLFLCYAVLEHMTVSERLEVLELARSVVRPEGVIAVIETPNRLLPWDHHTSQLPFYSQLPDELAIRYRHRSPRSDFVAALDAAAGEGDGRVQETLTRWGRGMSYHELELVFEDLAARTLATSWELDLLAERNIHREELALQSILDEIDPSLPPSFSRYWLDLIIAATPAPAPVPHMRPWAIRAVNSPGCSYDRHDIVRMSDASASLSIGLPAASRRLIIGAQADGPTSEITVVQPETGKEVVLNAPHGPHGPAYGECRFDVAAERYELRLGSAGIVSFVGYER